MNRIVAITSAVLVCSIASMVTGCSSLTKRAPNGENRFFDKMPWVDDTDRVPEPYPNPVKLAVTWSPDTLTQSGRVPTRGFGGRVFFYDEKSRPVAVDGTLVVHGFDESAEDRQKAMKRYEFTPEQFTRHFSQSDLGASYSIWIPWDAVGGKQTRVSLVATFQPGGGKTIQSIPSTVLLPGHRRETEADVARRFAPEYHKWKQAAAGNLPPTSGLTTTTIMRPETRQRPERPEMPKASTGSWNIARRESRTPAIDVARRPAAGSVQFGEILASQDSPAAAATRRPNAEPLRDEPTVSSVRGAASIARPAATRLPPLNR